MNEHFFNNINYTCIDLFNKIYTIFKHYMYDEKKTSHIP